MLITEGAEQRCHNVTGVLEIIMPNSSFQESGFIVCLNCGSNVNWRRCNAIQRIIKISFPFMAKSGDRILQYSDDNMYSCPV
jgi:hypothetical protein